MSLCADALLASAPYYNRTLFGQVRRETPNQMSTSIIIHMVEEKASSLKSVMQIKRPLAEFHSKFKACLVVTSTMVSKAWE